MTLLCNSCSSIKLKLNNLFFVIQLQEADAMAVIALTCGSCILVRLTVLLNVYRRMQSTLYSTVNHKNLPMKQSYLDRFTIICVHTLIKIRFLVKRRGSRLFIPFILGQGCSPVNVPSIQFQ